MKPTHIVAAIICNPSKDKIYITKRQAHQDEGGLWEFPGGKVEENEMIQAALIRELTEEIDIKAIELTIFDHFDFETKHKSLTFDFFIVSKFEGTPFGKEGQLGKWVDINQLTQYQFPLANERVLAKMIREGI